MSRPAHTNLDPLNFLYSKFAFKSVAASAALKHVEKHYEINKVFYSDFVKFNLGASTSADKKYNHVIYTDLPEKVQKELERIARKLDKSTEKIFAILGTKPTFRNGHCPLEAKWAFEYFKKYNTWEYHENNKINFEELMSPLSRENLEEYLAIF